MSQRTRIHAGHIDADEFADSTTVHAVAVVSTLEIFAYSCASTTCRISTAERCLPTISGALLSRQRNLSSPPRYGISFSLISAKTSNSLRELTVEHHIDPAIETDSNSNNILPQANILESRSQFTIVALRPLANLLIYDGW